MDKTTLTRTLLSNVWLTSEHLLKLFKLLEIQYRFKMLCVKRWILRRFLTGILRRAFLHTSISPNLPAYIYMKATLVTKHIFKLADWDSSMLLLLELMIVLCICQEFLLLFESVLRLNVVGIADVDENRKKHRWLYRCGCCCRWAHRCFASDLIKYISKLS